MSSDHYEMQSGRSFTEPILVVALEGWVDAGIGAGAATATLLAGAATDALVTFDSEYYLDQRARRPVARIIDGVTVSLTWPAVQLRSGQDPVGRDVLFLVGPEPDFHWREFVGDVVELSGRFGVQLAVALGAFPAPAPHTRPVKLAATAPPESSILVGKVGSVQGELEVPAGVQAALEVGFGHAGIDAVSLWARVPHYVSAMPFPEASAALIDGLNAVSGLTFSSTPLRSAADNAKRQVDELIAGNPEHQEMVRKLERTVDAAEGNPLGIQQLPSGDEIAAELERFLRGEES